MLTNSNRALLVFGLMIMFVCSSAQAVDLEKININSATADELTRLQGIGEIKAREIVDFREGQGLFKTPEDIMKVPGIGPKTFEKNRERIVVE